MSLEYLLSGVATVLVLVYLLFALLHPSAFRRLQWKLVSTRHSRCKSQIFWTERRGPLNLDARQRSSSRLVW
jgi:hypothetical protein